MSIHTNPQQHLNSMVLMYAGQLAAEGEYKALMSIGFTREHIVRLRGINLADMAGMARSLKGTVIDAKIDPDAIDALFDIAERVAEEKATELALVKAGASQKLMHRLFGLNVHQYVMDREYLGIKGADVGRRGSLDEATLNDVWQLWQSLGRLGEARRYLAVHAATRVLVRDIEAALGKHPSAGETQDGHGEKPFAEGEWHAYNRVLARGFDAAPGSPAPQNNTKARLENDGA